MSEAWQQLIVGIVLITISIVFALNRRINWEGGGQTRASEQPIIFWLLVVGLGCAGVVLAVLGILVLLGLRQG